MYLNLDFAKPRAPLTSKLAHLVSQLATKLKS